MLIRCSTLPDFRAYEHAFMMMAQVSGRAGRKGKRGLGDSPDQESYLACNRTGGA